MTNKKEEIENGSIVIMDDMEKRIQEFKDDYSKMIDMITSLHAQSEIVENQLQYLTEALPKEKRDELIQRVEEHWKNYL